MSRKEAWKLAKADMEAGIPESESDYGFLYQALHKLEGVPIPQQEQTEGVIIAEIQGNEGDITYVCQQCLWPVREGEQFCPYCQLELYWDQGGK